MAVDVLGGYLLVMEGDNDTIPKPFDFYNLARDLERNQQLQLVTVDTNIIRAREENKTVNKMVTLSTMKNRQYVVTNKEVARILATSLLFL